MFNIFLSLKTVAVKIEISWSLKGWNQIRLKDANNGILPKFVFQFRQPPASQNNSFVLLLNFSEVSLKLHSGSVVKWKIHGQEHVCIPTGTDILHSIYEIKELIYIAGKREWNNTLERNEINIGNSKTQ